MRFEYDLCDNCGAFTDATDMDRNFCPRCRACVTFELTDAGRAALATPAPAPALERLQQLGKRRES